MKKHTYVAVHHHDYGVTVNLFQTTLLPQELELMSDVELAKRVCLNFETGKGESLDIYEVNLAGIIDIDKKAVEKCLS